MRIVGQCCRRRKTSAGASPRPSRVSADPPLIPTGITLVRPGRRIPNIPTEETRTREISMSNTRTQRTSSSGDESLCCGRRTSHRVGRVGGAAAHRGTASHVWLGCPRIGVRAGKQAHGIGIPRMGAGPPPAFCPPFVCLSAAESNLSLASPGLSLCRGTRLRRTERRSASFPQTRAWLRCPVTDARIHCLL